MRKVIRAVFFSIVGLFIVYVSLLSLSTAKVVDSKLNISTLMAIPQEAITLESDVNINEVPLRDNPDLYRDDDPASVAVVYVTVQMGNAKDNTDHSWSEINDFTNWTFARPMDDATIKAEALVQFGDEIGPRPGDLGYSAVVPNATIQLRANPTSPIPQGSYKIELRKSAGLWRGQSTIVLNKHISDLSRVRQKLSFDLIKQIPNMVGLRTQFVHLYVRDETTDPPHNTFVDYGLYTQIEQPNKKFLSNHLLDRDGQLYKAVTFDFTRYPDQIRLTDDPLYNESAFSQVLEIKGNKDHAKLIKMLNDVNDYSIPIEQTFAKYFNADNYFTWMAYNILVGNISTENQNFFLYSPKNGDKWFFIPWDYDGAFPLRNFENESETPYLDWQSGVSNYWGSVLHNRVLRVDTYRQMLDEKIKEMMLLLTPARISDLLDAYKPVTAMYVSSMPDVYYLPSSLDAYNQTYSLLPDNVQENYELYLQSLERPMPFKLGTPKITGDRLTFNWGEANDFQSKTVVYHFEVSTDWTFEELIYDQKSTNLTSIDADMLESGEYFWRVTATNENGNSQLSYDQYFDAEGLAHPGIKYFMITPDGQVLEE